MRAPNKGSAGHRKPARLAVAGSALIALLLPGCSSPSLPSTSPAPAPSAEISPPRGDPQQIRIPSIEVRSGIVPVGLESSGAMETPDFGIAGWYTQGPRPGEVGPAVIVAHVDSKAGPDVFYRLRELRPGDEIAVSYPGQELAFRVEHLEQTPKDELPVERIWDDPGKPVLRLLTCGGAFNRSTGHYLDNIIVYASPVEG